MSSATETNPAFVLQRRHHTAIEDRAVPALRSDRDVRVRVEATGICGSDVHFWQLGRIGDYVVDGPMVLGHESCGVVVEAGAAVSNVKVGDRVAIEPGVPCRHCEYCRRGIYAQCPDMNFAATPPHDGTLQKYYVVAGDYCYALPPHLTAEDGALVEPVAVAVQVLSVAGDMRPGQTVLVFGCGPIGLLCQAVARAHGARRVVGVDISQARADFAKEFGADAVFVPEKGCKGGDSLAEARAVAERILDECGLGDGADVVLECTGAEPCMQAGVFATKKGGTFVQAGLGRESVLFPITIACVRSLTIRGSIRYSAGCYPQAVHLVATGQVEPRKLITHRYKFGDALEAFEQVHRAHEDTLKVIIEGVPE